MMAATKERMPHFLEELMKLIYRAQVFDVMPKAPQSDRQLCAVNWRFQVAGGTSRTVPQPVHVDRSHQAINAHQAINWRFQVAEEV